MEMLEEDMIDDPWSAAVKSSDGSNPLAPALKVPETLVTAYGHFNMYPGAMMPYGTNPVALQQNAQAQAVLLCKMQQPGMVNTEAHNAASRYIAQTFGQPILGVGYQGLYNCQPAGSEYDWARDDYDREDAKKLQKLLRKAVFGSETRRKACRDAFEAKTLLRPAGR